MGLVSGLLCGGWYGFLSWVGALVPDWWAVDMVVAGSSAVVLARRTRVRGRRRRRKQGRRLPGHSVSLKGALFKEMGTA